MEELALGPQLHTFVRVGVESTLERSQSTREHLGQLLLQLLRQGPLPKSQFIKGWVPLPPHTPAFPRSEAVQGVTSSSQAGFCAGFWDRSFLVFLDASVPARFVETLEQADDMAIDIPHIWLYLAELLSPVLKEGGFSMRELFR